MAVALMIAELEAETFTVRTANVPLAEPAGIVILLAVGVATAVLLLRSATAMPVAGAAHSSVTVPVTGFGPTTGFGVRLTDRTPMRRTVSAALFVTAPNVAVTLPA